MKKAYYIVLMVLCLVSCKMGSGEVHSLEEFREYINNPDNGLIQTQEIGHFIISAQYLPKQYTELMNGEGESGTGEKTETEQYLLRIASNEKGIDALALGAGSSSEYQYRVSYLFSGINRDCLLIDNTDTIKCVMHHYERNYGLTNFHNVLLFFEKPQQESSENHDRTIVFNDQIFGLGRLSFNFNKNDINNTPTINLR
jgi:hypothetical protein